MELAVSHDDDNETWLLDEGARVIERKAVAGYSSLTPRQRLIYCLWSADYGMRNAGDIQTAADLHPTFMEDGRSAAQELGFPQSTAFFSLSAECLEQLYFGLFDGVVVEIRVA